MSKKYVYCFEHKKSGVHSSAVGTSSAQAKAKVKAANPTMKGDWKQVTRSEV